MNTKNYLWRTAGAAALLVIVLVALSAAVAAAPENADRAQAPDGAALMAKADAEGQVLVIVGLDLTRGQYVPEGMLSLDETNAQRSAIEASSAALIASLEGYSAEVYAAWESVPYVAMKVDAAALAQLAANPNVTSIQEDKPSPPTLASSTAHIGADNTWAAGYGGQGQTVVILDTGIDANHPFYGGRVVAEACWSNAGGAGGQTSVCPNGGNSQTGTGSADALTAQCMSGGFSICDHGSHVAGIAAGRDPGGTGATGFNGIAPQASIIAIQVFTRFNNDANCGGNPGDAPCVKTFASDQISGLDYINTTLRNSYSIASANMSLGGGEYTGACDGDSRKAIIDTLRSNSIATVISSGNDDWTNRLGAPGCISTAVTVGSVTDPADGVTNNMNAVVDLLAPGSGIDSSIPDDTYANFSGTSMAAPHVTGAFAMLKAIDPTMSVDDIETLLENTGVLVTDLRPPNPAGDLSGLTKPRIQLDAAVAQLTSADLRLFKDCKPDDPMLVGQTGICTITVENLGPDAAVGVEVVDEYVSNGSFSFGSIIPPGTCTITPNPQNNAGTVTCDIGGLPAGGIVTIKIAVSATSPQNINDRATVRASTPDPNTANNVAEDELNVTAPVDLQVFKECKPDLPGTPLYAGQTGVCTIRVHNWGPAAASNVQLTDVHTAGTGVFSFDAVTRSQGSCSVPGNPQNGSATITCSLGALAAGAEATVTVEVTAAEGMDVNDTATAAGAEADPHTANNSAGDGLTFVASANLALTKTAAPTVIAGTNLTYDLSVTNNGPSTAKNVVIKDVLPAGVTIVSVSAPGGTCNPGIPGNPGQPTSCTFDTMAPAAMKTMQIVVRVDPSVLGVLGNNAVVSADTYDPDNSNNLATTATTVEGSADLTISKTDSPDPVLAGNVLTYDVKITNNGPSTALDPALTDAMPSQVTFLGYQVQNGSGACSLSPAAPYTLSCDLNDLLPGQFVRVVFTVLVNPSTPDGTVITNTATAAAATPDPNPANNNATAQTLVNARADLSISKDARADYTNPSPRVVYTIVVTNLGPSDAQAVVMTDKLPLTAKKLPFLYYNGVGPAAGQCTYTKATHTFSCSFGTLVTGDSRTVDVWLDARGSVGTITNTASVSSSTSDPNTANNSARKDVRIKGGPGPK